MAKTLDIYRTLSTKPLGSWIFSKLVGFSAPFFAKIHPQFVRLDTAYCEVNIKDRRSVRNHIGSINAGALCSLAELVGGLALDTCVPSTMRWIPTGMSVNYLAKARGTLTGISDFDPQIVKPGEVIIPVSVTDSNRTEVFNAAITFLVSAKA